jgi:polyribonucleotide nucleotidyltransferase
MAKALDALASADLDVAYQTVDKQQRVASISSIKDRAMSTLVVDGEVSGDEVKDAFKKLKENRSRADHSW